MNKFNQFHKPNKLMESEVAWNSSNLFYFTSNQWLMDFAEAYYNNDYDRMLKAFNNRWMISKIYVQKHASNEEIKFLEDEKFVDDILIQQKPGSTDFVMRHNNKLINDLIKIIRKKMMLLEELLSKAGMNLLLRQIEEFKPAAFGTDDFSD